MRRQCTANTWFVFNIFIFTGAWCVADATVAFVVVIAGARAVATVVIAGTGTGVGAATVVRIAIFVDATAVVFILIGIASLHFFTHFSALKCAESRKNMN